LKNSSIALISLKQYYNAAKKHTVLFYISLLNPIGSMASNVGVPFFAGLALSSAALQDGNFYKYIIYLSITVLVAIFFNRIGFTQIMKLQAKVMADLNSLVFERILYRGIKYHNNNIGGKIVSDGLDYIQSFSNLWISILTSGASFVISLILGLAIVFSQSFYLGSFLSVVVAISIIAAYIDSVRRSRLRSIRYKATKKLVAHYSDSLVNSLTIKAFGLEDIESKKNKTYNKELEKLRIADWVRAGKNGNGRVGFLLFSVVGLLLLYNLLVQRDPSVVGIGIFAFTYTFTLILRLFEINNLTRTIEESLLHAQPITKMLIEELEVKDIANSKKLNIPKSAEIKFVDVSFNYSDDKDTAVFENLNLHVMPGEKLGVVGRSGGGKSTLTKLLLRFEDIQKGSIKINEQNIKYITQKSLRSNIGYVPQEALLFHRSVKENISYGNQKASSIKIKEASKRANAHEFIEKLPMKYETLVGERGVKLSGGQRQRIAIARAMLKNAPILLLDEATSALDSESEQLIQDALWKLMEGKTAIVIAHRLSTIQKMDRIIVLDNGKIIEDGSHKELLKKKNGHYARLWKHQSGGFLQD
jgi:ATP-binding cassette subfamily B protein